MAESVPTRSNCPLCGAVCEADLRVVQTGFEQEALLVGAYRLILAVKEQLGEHGDPENEANQAWLEQTGEWLTGYRAVEEASSS